jgi:serine/threonine protein kinase
MAPELIKRKGFNYELVDVWALGVVLFAMITGQFPFKGSSNREIY